MEFAGSMDKGSLMRISPPFFSVSRRRGAAAPSSARRNFAYERKRRMDLKLAIGLVSLLILCLLLHRFYFRPTQSQFGASDGEVASQDSRKSDPGGNDPIVAPVFLGLRRLLYSEISLKEQVEKIPEIYKDNVREKARLEDYARTYPKDAQTPEWKRNLEAMLVELEPHQPIADAVLLTRSGQSKQAVALLESDTKRPRNSRIDGDYYLALAYAKEQAGDLAGARNGIQKYLDSQDMEKSRSLLNFGRILRKLGAAISDDELNRVHGVIVELSIKDSIVTMAGFSDGHSRLFFGNGNSAPLGGEAYFPEETRIAAKGLTESAQQFAGKLPVEKDHPLPKQGRARIVLLTIGATYATEVDVNKLASGATQFNQLWEQANKLNVALVKFMMEISSERKK
jgi:hypothetical protein